MNILQRQSMKQKTSLWGKRLLATGVAVSLLLGGCVTAEPEKTDGPWALVPPDKSAHAATGAKEGITPLQQTTPQQPLPVTQQPLAAPVSPVIIGVPTEEPEKAPVSPAAGKALTPIPGVSASWLPLIQRLEADGVAPAKVRSYFKGLEEYSSMPMAVKVAELYRNAFERKAPTPKDPSAVPSKVRIYKGIVTQATVDKCKVFLAENKAAFASMEKQFGIPQETIVALLFVETKLGTFMGKEKAFWSLASMAAAVAPENVNDGIQHLPITKDKEAWLQSKLSDKSNWAYKELKALLTHCDVNSLDPHAMPGSVYGAIGICQFMPSNLKPYGADGNADGTIDLFEPADAIHSAASYLQGHGWSDKTVDHQRNTIKRYNNLTTYANTIITLAESIKTGVLQTAPPDAPVIQAGAKKAKAAKVAKPAVKAKGAKATDASKKPASVGKKAAPAKQGAGKVVSPKAKPKPIKP